MRKKTVIVLLFLALALVLSASLQIYFVTDFSGGSVYARGDEAYFFTGASHAGYHFSYLKYLVVLITEKLNIPTSWNDQIGSSLVFHVTPSMVERHVIHDTEDNATGPRFMTPFEDGFYAVCTGAIFCKWTSKGFKPATKEEERSHGGVDHLVRADEIDLMVNGWHVRHTSRLPGEHFNVEFGKGLVLSVQNHATEVRYPSFSVDLLRPGQPPENLYNVNGTPHRVSKSEYERIFKKP
jgi:hypothetical protein